MEFTANSRWTVYLLSMNASIPEVPQAGTTLAHEREAIGSGAALGEDESEEAARDYDFYLARAYLQFLFPLWALAIALRLAAAPLSEDIWNALASATEVPAFYVLLALAVGWCLRSYHSAMRLATLFLKIQVVISVLRLVALAFEAPLPEETFDDLAAIFSAGYALMHLVNVAGFIKDRRRVIAGGLLLLAGCVAMTFVGQMRGLLHAKAYAMSAAQSDERPAMLDIPVDRLWEEQPEIVESAASLRPAAAIGADHVYLAAIAPDGTQALFEREARHALDVFSARFAERVRMQVLLSNRGETPQQTPLATNGNLDRLADIIRANADANADMVIIYLTAHGSRDARLSTILADYSYFEQFSAERLAQTLDRTGVKRRIVIVSACYSGSWIDPLKTDDSIIITASRKDRTSFGCSDDREMTYFAENFFAGPGFEKKSLEDRFTKARASIAKGEAEMGIAASEPQFYVGKNMQEVWSEPSS